MVALFADSVDSLGAKHPFWLSNSFDFDLRPVTPERPEGYLHPYTRMDGRQNILACAVASAYWTCATKEYLEGEIETFGQLYDCPWWVWNGCGLPITLLKSCLYYDCAHYEGHFTSYVYSLWCPAPRGASGKDMDSFRSFDLSYQGAEATCFIMQAVNDNGLTTQVWLDEELQLDEGGRGSTVGRRIRTGVFPKTVKLVVSTPQATSCAYVVVAQLGGVLEASDLRENVDGVDNPPGSWDRNPPPMIERIPVGWSRHNSRS